MKNLIPALMVTVIATASLFNAKAQNAQNSIAKLNLKVNTMQIGVTNENTNYINTTFKNSSTLSKASSRALKDFAKSFKSVANANWYDDGEGGFIAYFKDSTTYTRVDYNKRGNWVYTIATYSENELPSNVRFDVKMVYPLHIINSAQEIHYLNRVAYLIHVEDKKSFRTLRYTDEDGVEEIEYLQKYTPHS